MNMKKETKTCQNCKNQFTVEPEDFEFYERIGVPAPTWCPECRLKRRMNWRQHRTLYKVKCDLCGNKTLSIYHPKSSCKIYCNSCWWSDKWDPLEYGREYDFKRPFFEQFDELMRTVPKQAILLTNSVNCSYCDGAINSKNCYLNFVSYFSEDCFYCNGPFFSRNSVDADMGMNMDHAYEAYLSDDVYNIKFVWFSENCFDSSFLFDCRACSNCFGCTNLRHKKYHIFNKAYSKKDYTEKIKYWDLGNHKRLEEAKQKFKELCYSTPRCFARLTKSSNVTGNNLKHAHNCKLCFEALKGAENCRFAFDVGLKIKDSYDVLFCGNMSELLYECAGAISSFKCFFTIKSTALVNSEYCSFSRNGQHLFGCIALRNKQYCILNKQYTKEEYEKLVPKIKEHMDKMPYKDNRGNIYRYGEFFPDEFSPWNYNESYCFHWFPMLKDEALKQGYRWREKEKGNHKVSIRTNELPEHIEKVPDSIVEEVIECAHRDKCCHGCTEAFKIIPRELEFYRKMKIALPRICPNCRFCERAKWNTPPKLWKRKCQCAGEQSENGVYKNKAKHFHGNTPCPNEFETPYAPERKEIVYCEKCYQEEVI